MKKLLFAAALGISSIALAQAPSPTQVPTQPPEAPATTGDTTQPPAASPLAPTTQDVPPAPEGETATEEMQPSGETVDDPSQATGPQGVTQQGTVPDGVATPPPGANQPPQMSSPGMMQPSQSAAFTPRPAAGEYPPCSRTVTDACIQTYERGVRRPQR